jgi:hypothetical protein
MRNNLIGLSQAVPGSTGSSSDGTSVTRGSKANVVNNFYVGLPALANNGRAINNVIIVCNPFSNWANPGTSPYCGEGSYTAETARAGGAYVHGNIVTSAYNPPPAASTDLLKTQSNPFPAPPVRTTDAFQAACEVLAQAGIGAIDLHDQSVLAEIRPEVNKFGACP